MEQLSPIQKTAVLTAMQKAVNDKLSEVRPEADEQIKALCENDGVDRINVKLGSEKLGTFSIVFNSDTYEITDRAALDEFLLANGFADSRAHIPVTNMHEAINVIKANAPELLEYETIRTDDWEKYLEREGDDFVVSGTDTLIPGIKPKAQTIKGTQLRGCQPKSLLAALKEMDTFVDALLFEDGK